MYIHLYIYIYIYIYIYTYTYLLIFYRTCATQQLQATNNKHTVTHTHYIPNVGVSIPNMKYILNVVDFFFNDPNHTLYLCICIFHRFDILPCVLLETTNKFFWPSSKRNHGFLSTSNMT